MKYERNLGKWCWVSTETKNGWRLRLALGGQDFRLSGLLLRTEADVKRVTGTKGKIVFVHLKDNK